METRAIIWARSNGRVKRLKRPTGTRVKFVRYPTVRSKLMAILTRYSSPADHKSSSPSSDCMKNPMENGLQKLVQIFERNPTVGSKGMVILSRYSSVADQNSSRNCDSIATLRKMASENSCTNLSAIHRWDQKLWPYWPLLNSCRPDLLRPSCDSRATPRKMAYGNSCTIWAQANCQIKSFGPFKSLLSILPNRTSKAPSRESIATLRETASRNSCTNLSAFQRSDQKLWPFWVVTQVWPSRPPRQWVAIPKQPQGKHPSKTHANIWAPCNCRIQSYGHFDRYSSLAKQTSSSSSCHSIAIPREMAYGNSCNNLSTIQW